MSIEDYLSMIIRKQQTATSEEMYMAPATLTMVRDLLEFIQVLEKRIKELEDANG